jgi:hypothetical protein
LSPIVGWDGRAAEDAALLPAAVPAAAQQALNSQAAHRAIAVLVRVLFAPFTGEKRKATVHELSAGWRVPQVEERLKRQGAAPEAAAAAAAPPSSPDAATLLTIDRLAQRCTGVCLAGLRCGGPQSKPEAEA